MADLTRAEELVQTIDGDAAFRNEVEGAPTVAAKRAVLDSRGFQDVGLDDMRAYVERNGGTLVVKDGGQELSEQELASVAGGITDDELIAFGGGFVTIYGIGLAGAAAAIAA